jgi:hypothetical protein
MSGRDGNCRDPVRTFPVCNLLVSLLPLGSFQVESSLQRRSKRGDWKYSLGSWTRAGVRATVLAIATEAQLRSRYS